MKVTTCSATLSSQEVHAGCSRSGGGRAITPPPSAARVESTSGAPSGGLTTESGTTTTRRARASPRNAASAGRYNSIELADVCFFVVVEEILTEAYDSDLADLVRK